MIFNKNRSVMVNAMASLYPYLTLKTREPKMGDMYSKFVTTIKKAILKILKTFF